MITEVIILVQNPVFLKMEKNKLRTNITYLVSSFCSCLITDSEQFILIKIKLIS